MFALTVSIIGSVIFALLVALVYATTGGAVAVALVWGLKVAIGALNIKIGHAKSKRERPVCDCG